MNQVYRPSEQLSYCPRCGVPAFKRVTPKMLQCEDCSFELYTNPSAAVSALIVDGRDRLLATVRAHAPAQGRLDLPGGFVDPGESAEQAVVREVKEELGLDVRRLSYFCSDFNTCYAYGGVNYNTLDLVFRCQVENLLRACPADDVQEIRFLQPGEIKPEDFAFRSTQRIVQTYLDTRSTNL